MTTEVKNICKSCGEDRGLLREYLKEPDVMAWIGSPYFHGVYQRSENHQLACKKIYNCPDCLSELGEVS